MNLRCRHVAARHRRSGIAIIWVLFVLVLVSAVMGLVTRQHLDGRSILEHRNNRLQADWLARAGSEVALARLLQIPQAYSDDIGDLQADSKVHIEIQPIAGSTTNFEVHSEAHYPASDAHAILRSLTRRVSRVVEKGQVRLEAVGAK